MDISFYQKEAVMDPSMVFCVNILVFTLNIKKGFFETLGYAC